MNKEIKFILSSEINYKEFEERIKKAEGFNLFRVFLLDEVNSIYFTAKNKKHAFKIFDEVYGKVRVSDDSNDFYFRNGKKLAEIYVKNLTL